MGEMGIKRMRQPNLAVAQLREVAIGEDGPGRIAGKSVIDATSRSRAIMRIAFRAT